MVPIKQKRAQNLLDGSMLMFGLTVCLRVERCAVVSFAAQKTPQTPPKVSHEPRITISDECVWYTKTAYNMCQEKVRHVRCTQMSLTNETRDQYRVLCESVDACHDCIEATRQTQACGEVYRPGCEASWWDW